MAWAQKPAPLPPCGGCYICNLREWARAVHRVLRKDGVLFLNLGDSYFSGKSRYANTAGEWMRDKMLAGVPALAHQALMRDGWIVRSQLIWSKENAMPESSDDRPTTRHEVVLLAAKTADYWWDSDAIRRAYKITSIQRAGRDNSGEGKYSAGAHGQRPNRLALLAGPGKIRQCRRRGVANPDARLPSQESTQLLRTDDQGGAGTGLQAWRVETDNRRKGFRRSRGKIEFARFFRRLSPIRLGGWKCFERPDRAIQRLQRMPPLRLAGFSGGRGKPEKTLRPLRKGKSCPLRRGANLAGGKMHPRRLPRKNLPHLRKGLAANVLGFGERPAARAVEKRILSGRADASANFRPPCRRTGNEPHRRRRRRARRRKTAIRQPHRAGIRASGGLCRGAGGN